MHERAALRAAPTLNDGVASDLSDLLLTQIGFIILLLFCLSLIGLAVVEALKIDWVVGLLKQMHGLRIG